MLAVAAVKKFPRSLSADASRKLCLAVLAAALGAPLNCAAAVVEYVWVPSAGSVGSGLMDFDLGPGNTDGSNFVLPTTALTSFSFTFDFNNTTTTAALADLTQQVTSWSATNGFLTSVALLSKATLPQLTFQYQPNPGLSVATIQTSTGVQQNFGVWQLSTTPPAPVPLPAAGWLFLSGLGLTRLLTPRSRRR